MPIVAKKVFYAVKYVIANFRFLEMKQSFIETIGKGVKDSKSVNLRQVPP